MPDSKITTELDVDDSLVQDANYRFTSSDRAYIDKQIRGIERHLVDMLIRGQGATYYKLSSSSTGLVPGDCVCPSGDSSADDPVVTKATPAALAAAKVATGVVMKAAAPGGWVLVGTSGMIPRSITGLGTTAGYARVSTSAKVEYVAALSSSDFALGTVGPTGWLSLSPGNVGGGGGGTGPVTDEEIDWQPTASPNSKSLSLLRGGATSDATPFTVKTISLPDEANTDVEVWVYGRGPTGQFFRKKLTGAWSKTAGTATVKDAVAGGNAPSTGNPIGWDATLNLASNNVNVDVTGAAATDINWTILATGTSVLKTATGGGPADLPTLFGANLVGYLNENYTAATGVWVDEAVTSPVNTSQTFGASKRPAAGTINGHAAVDFDGVDDALNWGGDREVLTGDFTVGFVMQTAALPTSTMILAKLYGSVAWYVGNTFFGSAAGRIATGANNDGSTGGNAAFAESNGSVADGAAHVIIARRSGTTVTIYVDGVLQTDTGSDASAAITDTTEFIGVGAAMSTSDASTGQHYQGKLGQVFMVNRAATAGEVTNAWNILRAWAGI